MKIAHVLLPVAAAALLVGCLTGEKSEPKTKSWVLDQQDTANIRGGFSQGYDALTSSYQFGWIPGGGLAAYLEWPEDGMIRGEDQVASFSSADFFARCTVLVSGRYRNVCWGAEQAIDAYDGEFRVDTMGVDLRKSLFNDSIWYIEIWVGTYPVAEDTTWRCGSQIFGLTEIFATLSCKAK